MLAGLIPILKMLGPYAINLIGNRIGAGAKHGAAKKLQERLMALLDPNALNAEAETIFGGLKSSPVYSGMRSQAMTNSASLANNLNASFYRRGLGTSGIAGVATPLAQSSYGQTFANIDANLFTKALAMARENAGTRAGIIQDYEKTPEIGAGTWGGFMQDSIPNIYKLMEKYWGTQARATGTGGIPTRLPGSTPPFNPGSVFGPPQKPYPTRPPRGQGMF